MKKLPGTASRNLTLAFLSAAGKLGFSENLGLTIKETMASKSRNSWLNRPTRETVSLSLYVTGIAPLKRFTDPEDKSGFLAWFFKEGSHVTIPGLAEKTPVRNGYLQLLWYRNLDYYYEFTGSDGKEYYFKGSKDLHDLNQFRAWTTLYGGVHESESGKKVIESTSVFGETGFIPKGICFLLSFKLRKA